MRKYILLKLGRIIRSEIKSLSCLDSILCSQSPNVMQNFHWNMVYDELKLKSPVFLGVLISATHTRTPHPNRVAVICVCASILLKCRLILIK